MKVFWAWQSDHPGRISRFVIREALKQAIEHLKDTPDIDEPDEEARRRDLHLDHDTEGNTGSPSVGDTILQKIAASTVVVCDVTPVGSAPPIQTSEGEKPGRPLMNPNVAIELGYAMGKLSDSAVIGVMNLAFGSTESLPFDIKHKKWPVMYRLVEAAQKPEIEEQIKVLRAEFIKRLSGFLKVDKVETVFPEVQPLIGKGLFFADGEILAVQRKNPISNGQPINFTFPHRSFLYLRMIPKTLLVRPLAVQTIMDTMRRYGTFGVPVGALMQENAYGAAMSSLNLHLMSIDSMTQYFRNGEVWGINGHVIRQGERTDENWVPARTIEDTMITGLAVYCEYMEQHSHVKPPITVEAGIVGVKNRRLTIDGGIVGNMGKMYEDDVIYRTTLPDFAPATQDAFLKEFFTRVHDNTGIPRPQGLHGRW